MLDLRLEGVSPVEHHVDPITTDAGPTIGVADGRVTRLTYPEILCRVVRSIAQVGCIVPQPVHAYAHARSDEIPEIPLPQQNSVAVKL